MKPVLKYRGGKSREIARFINYIPIEFDTYFEPFLGGGAVFFHLEPKKAVLNDLNVPLMKFYEQLKNQYPLMRMQLDKLQEIYEANQRKYAKLKNVNPDDRVHNGNEPLYYSIREQFNGLVETEFLEGVLYYFINKTAYSGMIRYNSKGQYNVPFGRYVNFNTKLINDGHHKLLNNAILLNEDYKGIFDRTTENDFMFLDPPYDCVFNDYGNIDKMGGFDEHEHERLAEEYSKLKCKALMIIGKTPMTESLYKDFIVDEYHKSYAVNIRNRFKNETIHLVVKNY